MNKILQAIGFQPSGVKLRVIKNMTMDLRDPKRALKYRRMIECRKVPPAIEFRP